MCPLCKFNRAGLDVQSKKSEHKINPAGIYLFKFNNGSTKTMCEICSKLTIKTRELPAVFIVNFK